MKKIFIVLLIAAMLVGIVACKPEGNLPALTENDVKTFQNYMSAFGHVRVLGDLDHVLKGEKVDDEPGVTVQSMVAGEVTVGKDSIVIPLTLTKYDFDGHRNPEDPSPEKYTRIATGKLTLTLVGAMNAEGTVFVANSYKVTDLDITLDVDDSEYIWLQLPELKVTADELTGIFTTAGGIAKASVTVAVDGGKAVGIEDVNTPKFGELLGDISLD